MPEEIPFLTAMYTLEKYRNFVALFVHYYNGDWNLAQQSWDRLVSAELTRKRGLQTPVEIIEHLVASETPRFAANYAAGKQYVKETRWKRFLARLRRARKFG